MDETFFSDKEILAEAIQILAKAGDTPVSSLQRKMSLGFARAGRLYDTVMSIPVIQENGGLEWLQEDGNAEKALEYVRNDKI